MRTSLLTFEEFDTSTVTEIQFINSVTYLDQSGDISDYLDQMDDLVGATAPNFDSDSTTSALAYYSEG